MAGFLSNILRNVVSDVVSDIAHDAGHNLAQKLNEGIKVGVPMEDGTVKTATLRTKIGGENDFSQGITEKVFCSSAYMDLDGCKIKTTQFKCEITEQDTIRLLCCVGEVEKNIHIPDFIKGRRVAIIGENCFAHVEAKSIYLPKTIEVIEAGAFDSCTADYIELKEGVKTIGENAFRLTRSLRNLNVPNTVMKLGKGAFFGCGAGHLNISSGLSEIPEECFKMCAFEKLVVPGNIKFIGKDAFSNCPNLRSVVLEEGVEYIGVRAFVNCPKLELIAIPNSVTCLEENKFSDSGEIRFKIHLDHPIWESIKAKKVDLDFVDRISLYVEEWIALNRISWVRANQWEKSENTWSEADGSNLLQRIDAIAYRDAASSDEPDLMRAVINRHN